MSCMDVIGNVRLMYRLVLAVDVEKYSSRVAREQLRAQTDLRHILSLAAQNAGLDRSEWYEQVSGDGELVVLPDDVDVSAVVGDFTSQLEMILAEFNRQRTGGTRLRLRLALHHGTLTPGPFGPAGDAPIVVSRLLDARPLRRVLADQQELDLALIVSQTLYQDVIRTGFCALDPDEFQAVRVNAKGMRYQGFIQRRPAVTQVAPAALRAVSGGDGATGLIALPGGRA
jgi:class 3 adenylate cyclase